MWDSEKKQVTIKDYPSLTAPFLRHTIIHEIVGHVFWDLSRKWRRNELVKFNELANSLPPVNDYVKKYEATMYEEILFDKHEDFSNEHESEILVTISQIK